MFKGLGVCCHCCSELRVFSISRISERKGFHPSLVWDRTNKMQQNGENKKKFGVFPLFWGVGFIPALLAPASAFDCLGLTQGLWVQYFYIPQTHRGRVRPNPCFFISLINVIISKKFSFLTYSKCRYSFPLNKKSQTQGQKDWIWTQLYLALTPVDTQNITSWLKLEK